MRNPFGVSQVCGGRLPYLFQDDQDGRELLRLCRTNRWQGQIVGPHGTGKTTLTHWLVDQLDFPFATIVHVTIRGPKFREIKRVPQAMPCDSQSIRRSGTLFCVDGIERLSWWHRRLLIARLCRPQAVGAGEPVGLLVTTHLRLPGLPVLFQTQFDTMTLERILKRVVQEQDHPQVKRILGTPQWKAAVERACQADAGGSGNTPQRFGKPFGNGREVLMRLYDEFEMLSAQLDGCGTDSA